MSPIQPISNSNSPEQVVKPVGVEGQILTQKRSSLLSRSLIVAGVCFLAIFAFSWILYFILNNVLDLSADSAGTTIIILYAVAAVLIIVSFIMSMVVWAKINTVRIGTIITTIVFYSVAEGIGFGILFFAIGLSTEASEIMRDVMLLFLAGGLIFAITGIIGTMLSKKATIGLGKFILIATIAYIVIMLITFIVVIVAAAVGNGAILDALNSNAFLFLIFGFEGILFILYIAFDFSSIKKSEAFINSELSFRYSLIFGYKLLIDLIGLIWVLIRIFLATRR
ncbi:MAG: hypothetical protein LBC44_01285 [Mycoplasmataceae bacterium]|nr:hypothetical protein [Mycoplasmataceae bacterium]